MSKSTTITIQELRRDPVGFLRKAKRGPVTVIRHSKPFAVVTGVKSDAPAPKRMQKMLDYAELARQSAKQPLKSHIDHKNEYFHDAARKYDIS